jgi:predicted CopG family antitoxin
MRTIQISDDVWNEIANRGEIGETPDDVLQRLLKIKAERWTQVVTTMRKRFGTQKLSAKVESGKLIVHFENGPRREWRLPPKSAKSALRTVTYQTIDFARHNGATELQILSVRNSLTDAGYHLTNRAEQQQG